MRKIYVVILLLISSSAFAQNMSSPYSIYGIGDIDHRNYGYNSGMGYAGLALKTTLSGTGNNPASIAALEKSFFLFDLGVTAKTVGYRGSGITAENSQNHDFTIKQLSASAKLASFWASTVGFKQFSSVNYQFLNTKFIEGTDLSYSSLYSGDGGLHEYYWNNGFSIGKHLLAGITSSFISGSINQKETLTENTGATIESTRSDYYGNGRFTYGLIYSGALNKKWNLSMGGRYSAKTRMNFERTLNVTDSSVSVIDNEFIKYTGFALPASYGGGLALTGTNGITVAADYTYDDWSALNRSGAGWRLVSSSKIAAGAEFASFVNQYNKTLLRKSFQFGGYFNRSYLQVKGMQINEYGVTAGLTRAYKSGLMISVSMEGGSRGTMQSNLIKENFGQLNFAISHRDFINSKARKVRYN